MDTVKNIGCDIANPRKQIKHINFKYMNQRDISDLKIFSSVNTTPEFLFNHKDLSLPSFW